MCTQPLGDYFAMGGAKPEFQVNNTALWRGYVGGWEVVASRLYLVKLTGTLMAFLPPLLTPRECPQGEGGRTPSSTLPRSPLGVAPAMAVVPEVCTTGHRQSQHSKREVDLQRGVKL